MLLLYALTTDFGVTLAPSKFLHHERQRKDCRLNLSFEMGRIFLNMQWMTQHSGLN